MWFWIYMAAFDMLIPLLMIGFGKSFSKKAPKAVNCVYGYRTSMSMKNKDTWEFAHRYIGRLWYILGLILVPVSIAALLCVLGKEEDTVGNLGAALCVVQMIVLAVPIIPTEITLRKKFNKYGIRKY